MKLYDFNKLLKQVNDGLPPTINVRYEKRELSLYSVGFEKKTPTYKRIHTYGTGSKTEIAPFLGGMLAHINLTHSYAKTDGKVN